MKQMFFAAAAMIALIGFGREADAREWEPVSASDSKIIFNTGGDITSAQHYRLDWNDRYSHRAWMVLLKGKNSRRMEFFLHELAPGYVYRVGNTLDRDFANYFNFLKNKSVTLLDTLTVPSHLGDLKARRISIGGRATDCVLFSRTSGIAGWAMRAEGDARFTGYYCPSTSDAFARHDLTEIVNRIGVRDVVQPKSSASEPAKSRITPPTAPAATSAPKPSTTQSPQDDAQERLTTLKDLLDKGLISKSDYDKKKAEILDAL